MATWRDISMFTWGELLEMGLTWRDVKDLTLAQLIQIAQKRLKRFQVQVEQQGDRDLSDSQKDKLRNIEFGAIKLKLIESDLFKCGKSVTCYTAIKFIDHYLAQALEHLPELSEIGEHAKNWLKSILTFLGK